MGYKLPKLSINVPKIPTFNEALRGLQTADPLAFLFGSPAGSVGGAEVAQSVGSFFAPPPFPGLKGIQKVRKKRKERRSEFDVFGTQFVSPTVGALANLPSVQGKALLGE